MNCIEFQTEENRVRDFIRLARRFYSRENNMQNDGELRALLLGKHPLSAGFRMRKFCVYRQGRIAGRFALTEYPEDETAYLGFFECEEDGETAAFLFSRAEAFARERGFRRIIGPVDASFWIKYRLKTNLFDRRPYTGEPYNPPWYPRLFSDNGYRVRERYTSSLYSRVPEDFRNEKFASRREAFEQKGYRIASPQPEDWERTLKEVYGLVTKLYRDFPAYKHIPEETFCGYFDAYRKIIDLSMVKMAYYGSRPAGFYISVPNYGNLVHHARNPLNLLRILKTKGRPEEYVMLYMGVDPAHQGLGKALAQSIVDELRQNGCASIGALQREGKVTRHYVKELISQRYEYVLLGKDLL